MSKKKNHIENGSLEAKIAALSYLQDIINRLSGKSSNMKLWALTIVSGLVFVKVTGVREISSIFATVIILLIGSAFWYLNFYYIKNERIFREVYNKLARRKIHQCNFFDISKEFKKIQQDQDIKYFKSLRIFISSLTAYYIMLIAISILVVLYG